MEQYYNMCSSTEIPRRGFTVSDVNDGRFVTVREGCCTCVPSVRRRDKLVSLPAANTTSFASARTAHHGCTCVPVACRRVGAGNKSSMYYKNSGHSLTDQDTLYAVNHCEGQIRKFSCDGLANVSASLDEEFKKICWNSKPLVGQPSERVSEQSVTERVGEQSERVSEHGRGDAGRTEVCLSGAADTVGAAGAGHQANSSGNNTNEYENISTEYIKQTLSSDRKCKIKLDRRICENHRNVIDDICEYRNENGCNSYRFKDIPRSPTQTKHQENVNSNCSSSMWCERKLVENLTSNVTASESEILISKMETHGMNNVSHSHFSRVKSIQDGVNDYRYPGVIIRPVCAISGGNKNKRVCDENEIGSKTKESSRFKTLYSRCRSEELLENCGAENDSVCSLSTDSISSELRDMSVPVLVPQDNISYLSNDKLCQTDQPSVTNSGMTTDKSSDSIQEYRRREEEMRAEIMRQKMRVRLYEVMLNKVQQSFESLRKHSKVELEGYRVRVEHLEQCLQRSLTCPHCSGVDNNNKICSTVGTITQEDHIVSKFTSGESSPRSKECTRIEGRDVVKVRGVGRGDELNDWNSKEVGVRGESRHTRYAESSGRLYGGTDASRFNQVNDSSVYGRVEASRSNQSNDSSLYARTENGRSSDLMCGASSETMNKISCYDEHMNSCGATDKAGCGSVTSVMGCGRNDVAIQCNMNQQQLTALRKCSNDKHFSHPETKELESRSISGLAEKVSSLTYNPVTENKSCVVANSSRAAVELSWQKYRGSSSSVDSCEAADSDEDRGTGSSGCSSSSWLNVNTAEYKTAEAAADSNSSMESLCYNDDTAGAGLVGVNGGVKQGVNSGLMEVDRERESGREENVHEEVFCESIPSMYLNRSSVRDSSDSESDDGLLRSGSSSHFIMTPVNQISQPITFNDHFNSNPAISGTSESSELCSDIKNKGIFCSDFGSCLLGSKSSSSFFESSKLFDLSSYQSDTRFDTVRSAREDDSLTPQGGDVMTSRGGDLVTLWGGDLVIPRRGDLMTPREVDLMTLRGGDLVTPREDAVIPREDAVTPREDAVIPREDAVTPREDAVTPHEDAVTPRGVDVSFRSNLMRSSSETTVTPRSSAADKKMESKRETERLRSELVAKDESLRKLRAALREMSVSHGELLDKNFVLQDYIKGFRTPQSFNYSSSSGCSSSSGTWRRANKLSAEKAAALATPTAAAARSEILLGDLYQKKACSDLMSKDYVALNERFLSDNSAMKQLSLQLLDSSLHEEAGSTSSGISPLSANSISFTPAAVLHEQQQQQLVEGYTGRLAAGMRVQPAACRSLISVLSAITPKA